MFPDWINLFKRSPRVGGGKDRTMSQPIENPGTAVPGNAPTSNVAPVSGASPDVARQIADLTDAVNRLVQAQQPQASPPPVSSTVSAQGHDIGGDIPGGHSLTPAVDYARLSPLQQITLGLRDAKPVGPGSPGIMRTRDAAGLDSQHADQGAFSGAD